MHARTQVPGEAAEGVVSVAGAEPEADGHEQAAHGGERPPAEAGLAARLRERLLPPADAAERTHRLSHACLLLLSSLFITTFISPFYCCAVFIIPLPTTLLQAGLATTDTSCESVVTSGHQNVAAAAPQAQPRDAGPAGYVTTYAILLLPCQPARAAFAFISIAMLLWHGWPGLLPYLQYL